MRRRALSGLDHSRRSLRSRAEQLWPARSRPWKPSAGADPSASQKGRFRSKSSAIWNFRRLWPMSLCGDLPERIRAILRNEQLSSVRYGQRWQCSREPHTSK